MNFNISKLLVNISRFPLTVARKNLGNVITQLMNVFTKYLKKM